MMFTIVTIVFLPLSFIASFFAINVAEFPHEQSGNTNLPLSYVSKYIFGIGFAISIPLVLLALSVDDIRHGSRNAWRRIRQWQLGHDKQKGHREQQQHISHDQRNNSNNNINNNSRRHNMASQALEFERILSAAKSSRSNDTDDFFGTGLLPVATKNSTRSPVPRNSTHTYRSMATNRNMEKRFALRSEP